MKVSTHPCSVLLQVIYIDAREIKDNSLEFKEGGKLSTVDDASAEAEAVPLPKQLATPQEVADFLHTTPAALSQDRYLGRGIAYVKHGRKVLYRWSDVHAYIAANTVNPGAA